jgi:hypothetical protein
MKAFLNIYLQLVNMKLVWISFVLMILSIIFSVVKELLPFAPPYCFDYFQNTMSFTIFSLFIVWVGLSVYLTFKQEVRKYGLFNLICFTTFLLIYTWYFYTRPIIAVDYPIAFKAWCIECNKSGWPSTVRIPYEMKNFYICSYDVKLPNTCAEARNKCEQEWEKYGVKWGE